MYVIVLAQVDYVHVHVCDCPGDCVLPIYANCVYLMFVSVVVYLAA